MIPRKKLVINQVIPIVISIIFFFSGCGKLPWEKKEESAFNFITPKKNIVLALYDASEKTLQAKSGIEKFIKSDLEKMGLTLKYHDISRGIPSKKITHDIRGIISWFTDSKMKNASSYCKWLSEEIDEGKKVIILDNFGAYQDSKTGEWTSMSEVNEVFSRLGVIYKANWTQDSTLLEIVYKDPSVVEKVSPLDLSSINHYYLFEKKDSSLKPFLIVKRKDSPSSESNIIFSHPNGGMALSRYFMTTDAKTSQSAPNIDFSIFLNKCFLGESALKEQRFLVVWDKEGDTDNEYIDNLAKTFEYAKLSFEVIKFEKAESLLLSDLSKYTSVIFITENLWKIDDERLAQTFKDYVSSGGGIMVMMHCGNDMFNDMFGITRMYDYYPKALEGLKLSKSFFPGSPAFSFFGKEFEQGSIKFEIKKDIEVLAWSGSRDEMYPEGIPVAWVNKFGKGRVVFWNSNCLVNKTMRGILLQSIMLAQNSSVYFLANIENIHMDDSPQPMYNILKDPVKTDYNMTDTRFYMDVWWKDILALSKKYGIRFTFYAIFNYDNVIEPPFTSRAYEYGENSAFKELTARILENNFELGLHGYNHQSPIIATKEVPGWKSKKYMKMAMMRGREIWEKEMPKSEIPISYVAPMNVIGPEGKKALHEVFPEIKVISQHYSESIKEREQEFGTDPDVPELFDLPRVSAGYWFDQDSKNCMIDAINNFGVWTHFVHPDDVYGRYSVGDDYAVAGKSAGNWSEMIASTHEMFDFARNTYPWLRNMTTKEAYYELIRYFERNATVEMENGNIKVTFTSGDNEKKYFCLRVNDKKVISQIKDCKLLHTYDTLNMFIFETDSNIARIELKESK